jgi:hypothetical protein
VQKVLTDGGYVNADAFELLGRQEVEPYVAVTGEDQNVRKYDYRPPRNRSYKKLVDPRLVAMREKLAQPQGKRIYAKRASTMEPVFGIIKGVMGFRQFLLRSIVKVKVEWDLVCLSCSFKQPGEAGEGIKEPNGAEKKPWAAAAFEVGASAIPNAGAVVLASSAQKDHGQSPTGS